jgi:hypothetical protein
MSPDWPQYEGVARQTPSGQYCEQHSEPDSHEFPDVLHVGFSGVQMSPSQEPPQQSPLLVHASPSETHWVSEQVKSTHEKEQQSGPAAQSSPAGVHTPGTREHTPRSWSQLVVQHSSLVVHESPLAVQIGPASGPPELSPQLHPVAKPSSNNPAPKTITRMLFMATLRAHLIAMFERAEECVPLEAATTCTPTCVANPSRCAGQDSRFDKSAMAVRAFSGFRRGIACTATHEKRVTRNVYSNCTPATRGRSDHTRAGASPRGGP